MIYESIKDLVGNTPLVHLNNVEKEFDLDCQIYAKLEKQNPAGSIKDRPVKNMLEAYLASGKSLEGATIIESTSGNTGIALASLSHYYKYKAVLVMPKSVSTQRRDLIRAFGAELILVDGGIPLCQETAEKILAETPNSFILGQFTNEANSKAHLVTAKEIVTDLPDVDYVFAGIGTGGTVTGISEYFATNNVDAKVIGIEPKESPFLTEAKTGKHKIQGIGAGFKPEILKLDNIEELVTVSSDETLDMAKKVMELEGYLVGISAGASLLGAINYAKTHDLKGKKIVVIFPDTGERYTWN